MCKHNKIESEIYIVLCVCMCERNKIESEIYLALCVCVCVRKKNVREERSDLNILRALLFRGTVNVTREFKKLGEFVRLAHTQW